MTDIPVPEISNDDIQLRRSQANLGVWVDEIIAKFGASKPGKRALRLGKGENVKVFKEEVFPLRLYADAYYSGESNVLFRNAVGNQSYDAIVEDDRGRPLEYVQLTQAIDGYQSHLKMLHQEKYGRAPITGPKLRKNKAGDIDEHVAEAENVDTRQESELQCLYAVVERKSQFRYEVGTVLVIYFNSIDFIDEDYFKKIDNFAKEQLVPLASSFKALAVVGFGHGLPIKYITGAV